MNVRTIRRPKAYIAMFFVLLCLTLSQKISVFAASDYRVSMSIPIQQSFNVVSGTAPTETFTYALTAMEKGNPMPEGNEGENFHISLKGNTDNAIGPIEYTAPGIYVYELVQEVSKREAGYTYAQEKYEISVYVKNTEQGGLQADMVVKNAGGEKAENAKFNNTFKSEASNTSSTSATPTPIQTPIKTAGKTTSPVRTGDENQVALWLSVSILAGICCIVFASNRRKMK